MNSIPEEILVNGSATLKNKLYNWIDPKAREFLTDFNHLLISTSFNEYEVQCFQKLKMTSKDDCAIDGKTEHQIVLDKQKKELQTMRKSESSIVKSILKLFSYKKSRSSISGAPAEDSADCQKQSANIEVSEIACEPSDVTKSSISVSNENYVSFPIKAAVVNLNDLTYFKKHPHFFEKVMHVLCVCSGDTMELNRNQEFYGEELFVLIYSNYYLCCKKLENFKTSKMHRKLLDLLEFCSRCRILRSRTIRNIFLWKESNDVVNAI